VTVTGTVGLRLGFVLASVVLGGTGVGCSNGTEPQSPSAMTVLLAEKYGYGPCAPVWNPKVPPTERTVVDFHFGSDGSTPSAAQVAAIEQAGAVVVHRFNVPILRAEIDVAAVPALIGWPPRGVAYYAVTVPDLSRREVVLIVFVSHDLTDADITAVQAIGGRIRHRYETLDGYSVEIDDDAVPLVRALPGVQVVSKNGIGCLA
jgi:hypothetical protein